MPPVDFHVCVGLVDRVLARGVSRILLRSLYASYRRWELHPRWNEVLEEWPLGSVLEGTLVSGTPLGVLQPVSSTQFLEPLGQPSPSAVTAAELSQQIRAAVRQGRVARRTLSSLWEEYWRWRTVTWAYR